MKRILIFTFCLINLTANSQALTTLLNTKKSLIADTFIGIDDFQNLYYTQDNILYKKSSKKLFSYSNIDLGKLTSVNIQNPFKLILFYSDFNAAIILDNNLNELTQKIDFTKETLFNNVDFVTGASQNNLWLFPDDNKLHLYDYQNNIEILQTQAMTFYDQEFIPLSIVSTYKNVWILSKNGVLEFNEYGVFIKKYSLEKIDLIFPFQKGFIYIIDGSIFYNDLMKSLAIPLDHESTSNSIYVNNSNIFIFDGNQVYEYQIKR